MKLATFFARDEIRSYEDSLAALQSEIERLRQNGIAQAKDLGSEIKALQNALEEAEGKERDLNKQLEEVKKTLDATNAHGLTLQEMIQTQAKDYDQRLETLEGKLKESTEEGELLLLQLHQVQEELETVFLNEQAAAQSLREKDTELNALKKQNESLLATEKRLSGEKTALAAERDQEKKDAQNDRAKADATIAALTREKHELVSALEGKTRALDEAIQQRDERAKVEQILTQERDEQAKIAIARQKDIDRLKADLEGQVREAQEENELLLLQLHQVQEELEHYFLEHQKLLRENELQLKRWQRLEARFPNYLDCESVVPVAVDALADEPKVDWRVRDVTVAGSVLPEFSFTTFLRDGKVGIAFKSESEGVDEVLSLVPRALTQPQAQAEIVRFRNFRSSEWRRFLVAASAIEQFFAQGKISVLDLPEDFDLAFWRQSILPVVADIRALPPMLRFERAQLKRELVHTDYEHLWLLLQDVSFGNLYRWPKFELRLGASSIIPGGFSRHPKLELPRIEGKTTPFPSWFEESYDDFGGKFELRFELARKLFDVGVWSKLQAADQSLVIALIGALPFMLDRMQAEKVTIARPWQEWRDLANGMADVLRLRFSEARTRASQPPKDPKEREEQVSSVSNVQRESSTEPKPHPSQPASGAAERLSSSDAMEEPVAEVATLTEESSAGFRHPNRNKRHKRR